MAKKILKPDLNHLIKKTNMKKITYLFLLIFPFSIFCQYGNLNINTKFDQVYGALYANEASDGFNSYDLYYNYTLTGWSEGKRQWVSLDQQNNLGSTKSSSLDALLVMFEATCDQKYLLEFMKQAAKIVNLRADKVSPKFSSAPYWFKDQIQWHARILQPFSKFVYLINSQWQSLYNVGLTNPSLYGGNSTFGQFATWLNVNNIQVMDYMLGKYWITESMSINANTCGGISDNTWFGTPGTDYIPAVTLVNNQITDPSHNRSGGLNFQAPWGCALIYMYLANGDAKIGYATKAVQLARLFLNSGMLSYDATNNAYNWIGYGWASGNTTLKEDIGHGGWDIMFPMLYNKFYNSFYPHVTAGKYFEDYQMVRFKNTVSRNLFNYSASNISQTYLDKTTFYCTTSGSCANYFPAAAVQADFQPCGKLWTDLYKYDNVSGSKGAKVYDIMMQFYINVESNYSATNTNYGGLNIKGLADMCAANFLKEGINTGCYTKHAIVSGLENNNFEIADDNVFIYPNPASKFINVNINESLFANVFIYDLSGNELINTLVMNDIDVSSFSKGIYLVKIKTDKETVIKKLVIE